MSSSLASSSATVARTPRWPRPWAVDASVGLHACAGAAALAFPGAELWALGAVIANHAALGTSGLVPRSSWLGPNLRRLPAPLPVPHALPLSAPPPPLAGATGGQPLAPVALGDPQGPQESVDAKVPAVALTFDDGPDPEVTPRVLDLLDAAGARATFFCIAEYARRRPALTREIIARGHSVQNHSARHRHHFSLLGPRALEREVGSAQQQLADLTGSLPHCFRAPAGLRNALLDPVLHRLDLHLVSWTRRGFDTVDPAPARVLSRLARGLNARDILVLHDGHTRHATGHAHAVVLEVLPLLLQRLRELGMVTVTLTDAVPRRHAARAA